MASAETIDALNRLYVIHNRSLPMYLSFARPFSLRRNDQAFDTLAHVVTDQQTMMNRIGQLILESEGDVDTGHFPMFYTGYNDLTIEFLVKRAIEQQKNDIAAIGQCVEQLGLAPMAQALAEEALGLAKGHLDNLQDLNSHVSPAEPV